MDQIEQDCCSVQWGFFDHPYELLQATRKATHFTKGVCFFTQLK